MSISAPAQADSDGEGVFSPAREGEGHRRPERVQVGRGTAGHLQAGARGKGAGEGLQRDNETESWQHHHLTSNTGTPVIRFGVLYLFLANFMQWSSIMNLIAFWCTI